MADHQMRFTAPEIKALLAGRKTQARAVLKLPTKGEYVYRGGWAPTINGGGGCFTIARNGTRVPCPETVGIWNQTTGTCLDAPYQVSDRIYVREAWQLHGRATDVCTIVYAASINGPWTEAHEQFDDSLAAKMKPKSFQSGWRPSIHMPRWASRLTLIVTDVRVERLQDISEADAVAEGITKIREADKDGRRHFGLSGTNAIDGPTARHAFAGLWTLINGAAAWAANPWVTAISFETHHCNIDALPAVPAQERVGA